MLNVFADLAPHTKVNQPPIRSGSVPGSDTSVSAPKSVTRQSGARRSAADSERSGSSAVVVVATGIASRLPQLTHDRVGVRDSKNPTGPALVFTPIEWDAFPKAAKTGTFG
ncbi:DUF397 domain-containing protein [Nocardia rhamnosiphila]|uniref:DUF397 domain-containing protein n=1 Tax=Nocardia rhamnosiphila TaxID=426716 RepID=UPI0033C26B8C